MTHEERNKVDALDEVTEAAMPIFKQLAGEAAIPAFFAVLLPTYMQGGWPGIEWFVLGFVLALAWLMFGRASYQHALKQHFVKSFSKNDPSSHYGDPANASFWTLYAINAGLALTSTFIAGTIGLTLGMVMGKFLPSLL